MGNKRWAVLALCCVLLMSVAVLYAWSVFVIPLEGVYDWSRVETSGVFTLSMCSYCAGSLLSGFLSCHVTESVSKRGMEKVRPGKDGKASHIKGNSERA